MFSIIIPLYNKAPYIEKAIRSVTAQSCHDYELIIVDDGSTDGGDQIAVRLCEEAGGRLIRQHNSGVSITRNNGVMAAKYDYIAFLDADDWWDPDYLLKMKHLIELYPDAGIYSCGYYIYKPGGVRKARIGVDADFSKGLINYFQVYAKTLEMPVWTGAVILKKHIFISENGFNSKLKLGEDFDLWVRISLSYPVVFLHEYLAYYNQEVDPGNRAIGYKFYKPEEHMIFTDYSSLKENKDFVFLFELLALYILKTYRAYGKNKRETQNIIKNINWHNHSLKDYLYYHLYPPALLRFQINLKRKMITIKNKLKFK